MNGDDSAATVGLLIVGAAMVSAIFFLWQLAHSAPVAELYRALGL